MRRRWGSAGTFYCFSPPVMIATCVIEVGLAIWAAMQYAFSKINGLVILMLLLLAVFQLAEFRVCTDATAAVWWSRIGYIAITLLPPLGIHILSIMHKTAKRHSLLYLAYGSAFTFITYFAVAASSLQGHTCLGNYVFFQVNPALTPLYGVYYYGWVLVGIYVSLRHAMAAKRQSERQAFYGFTIGYVTFLVPTTTVNILQPATTNGIPSIMCGFAVLLAITTALYVLPRVAPLRSAQRHKPRQVSNSKK